MNLIRTTVADGRVIWLPLDYMLLAIKTTDGKITFTLAAPNEDVEVVNEGESAIDLEAILDTMAIATLQRLELQLPSTRKTGHTSPSQRTILPFTNTENLPEAIP